MGFEQLLATFGVALSISRRTLKPKEFVITDLNQDPQAIWMADGVGKVVLLLEEGREITKTFLTPGDFAVTPYKLNQDYAVFVQALSHVVIEQTNYSAILDASQSNEDLRRVVSSQWTHYESEKEHRFVIDQTLSSTERYTLVEKRLGEWADQVPLVEIAAYLGITPVQLSRIRKNRSGN